MTGKFVFLDTPTLQSMQSDWQACLKAIATAHQSYSIAGRSFTRANLTEVSEMVAEINYALALKTGQAVRTTCADFSS